MMRIVNKLTDIQYFQTLEEILRTITTPMLRKLEDTDEKPPPKHVSLGPMPDTLKAFLLVVQNLQEKRNEALLGIFHNSSGQTLDEIKQQTDSVLPDEESIQALWTIFFTALAAEFGLDDAENVDYGPGFKVFFVPHT